MSTYNGKANVTFRGQELNGHQLSLDDVYFSYLLEHDGWNPDESLPVPVRVGGTLEVHVGEQPKSQYAESVVIDILDGPRAGEQITFELGSQFQSKVAVFKDGVLVIHIK